MIVACSNCSKRYLVDPRALGTPGRRVRCANCQHTWFQAAPEEAQPSIVLPPLPESPPIVRTTAEAARRVQLPAVSRTGGGARWLRRVTVVAVLLLIVGGLITGRDNVISLFPFTERLYAMVGLGRPVPGAGLELRQVTPSRGVENGVPTLAINGQVANVSSVARAVPKLRVALRDGSNKELQSWLVAVTDQPLAPGASVPFHTTIQQPPDGATGVIVSFAPGGG